MKKIALVMLLAAGLASPAVAGPLTITVGDFQSGGGGEFRATVGAGGAIGLPEGATFLTFCIEENEWLQFGNTYDASLSDNSIKGGVGGPQPDPISVGTGWLFANFALGTLGSDTINTAAKAAAFQEAIWWLEQEITTYTGGNAYIAIVIAKFGSDVNGRANGGWNYGVQAVNLTREPCAPGYPGPDCQSLLAYVPDGGATLILLGGALMGMGALRRKIRL